MAKTNKKNIEGHEEPSQSLTGNPTLDNLLSSPDIQRAISQIPDLIRTNIETKNALLQSELNARTGITRGATKGILIWTAVLAFIIIAPVSLLSWYGKVSSDAATFLFGTVVGAAFTFLRTFFPVSK